MPNSLKELGNKILTGTTNEIQQRGAGALREKIGAAIPHIKDTPMGERLSAWGLLDRLEKQVQKADQAPDNIQAFITSLKRSALAQSNRFRVTFSFPNNFMVDTEALRTLTLMCEEASLPGRIVNTRALKFNGMAQYRAAGLDMMGESINFQFLVQNTFAPKVQFDRWMDYMVDPETRQIAFYENYIADIQIEALDKNNDTIYTVKLEEAFPRSIQVIPLSYSNSSPVKLQLSMAFKRWRGEPAIRPDIDLPDAARPESFKDKLARQAAGGLRDIGMRSITKKVGGEFTRIKQDVFRRTR